MKQKSIHESSLHNLSIFFALVTQNNGQEVKVMCIQDQLKQKRLKKKKRFIYVAAAMYVQVKLIILLLMSTAG